jgi:hypothetical protein
MSPGAEIANGSLTAIKLLVCDKSQETARPRQVAPIGNRLYRRLAAGMAAEAASQDNIRKIAPANRSGKNSGSNPFKTDEHFLLRPPVEPRR